MKRLLGYSLVIFMTIMLIGLTTNQAHSDETFLSGSADSPGHGHNEEGIKHAGMGHWDVAAGHFSEAVGADKNLAEAHYNLAVALHNQKKHGDAKAHFKHALDLAPKNPKIAGSGLLQGHLK